MGVQIGSEYADGKVTTDFGGFNNAEAIALQPDGKILVVGQFSDFQGSFVLVRYNADGSLDTTFDGDGKVTTNVGKTGQANTIILQPDDKILVAGHGYSNETSDDIVLVRYNADGSLDTTFGTDTKNTTDWNPVPTIGDGDGKVTTSISHNGDYASAITLQADGKILVAGNSQMNDGTGAFVLARYNADGSLDATFDGLPLNNPPTGTVTINDTTPEQNQTLIAANTLLDPDGLGTMTYQWQANNINIGTGNSYTLTSNEVGKTITVTASYTDGLGKAESIKSTATAAVTDLINQTPTATNLNTTESYTEDTVLNLTNIVVTDADSANITATLTLSNTAAGSLNTASSGAVTSTYNAGAWSATGAIANVNALLADVAFTPAIDFNSNFTVSTSISDGVAAAVTGSKSFTGTAVNDAPTGNVTIIGNAIKGQTLTASNVLVDADGLGAITYQWQANGINLGTGNNYTITANEVGKTIAVTASYTDGLGTPESVSSVATATVTDAPVIGASGISIIGGDFITSEQGDTAIFNVKLNAAPTRDVTIAFTSSDTTEGVITNSTLKFTSTNWSTAQTFTVIGQNDSSVDGDIAYSINAKITTLDVIYKSVTADSLTLTNQDTPIAKVETINGTDNIDILSGTLAPSYILGKAGDDDLSGGAGNDTIYGSYGNDLLFGEDDNDKLYGEQDADYLDGGAGNDTLDGGLGLDTLIGGSGSDTYYLGYDEIDVIDDQGLATDVDIVIMPYQLSKYTLPKGIEQGTIAAGTGSSNLTGNTGDNTLTGNDGKNKLIGAVGRDSLFGGLGDDVLNGGTGNDVLEGGTGKDNLTGGAGKDSFLFDTALKANVDKITDFKPIDDTLTLENSIFTNIATGALNTDNFVAATTAIDSNDYLVYNKATGALFYDADGSGVGAAVQIAVLGVNLALTNADFVII